MISQLAPPSNAFYFKDNYSKKDLITYANMRHQTRLKRNSRHDKKCLLKEEIYYG